MGIRTDAGRVGPIEVRQPLTVEVDGETVPAFAGESVATVLLAMGRRTFRHAESGAPRGLFCGMGVCFDCLVTVDGVENVRACVTPVADGMAIETTVAVLSRPGRSAHRPAGPEGHGHD